MSKPAIASNDLVPLPPELAHIPRVQLLFPHLTPIELLSNLTALIGEESLGPKYTFYIKREDANSGIAGGGNKMRKLEYVIADALKEGSDVLVTEGGTQSNHMRQVAGVGAKLNMQVALIPKDMVHSIFSEYYTLGNVQLNDIMAATTLPTGSVHEDVMEKFRSEGHTPYWIPSGASSHPLGGLGYARFAFELEKQEREVGVVFNTIVVACMSGSTIGGMIAGFKLMEKQNNRHRESQKKRRKVIGIVAGPKKKEDFEAQILGIARNAGEKIGLVPDDIQLSDFEIDSDFTAEAYGKLDQPTIEAIDLLASKEGIITDPVYTGKALTGMIARARRGALGEGGNVLFVHTGGVMSISAYPALR